MNKDQKLLEEAYQSIYESATEPLYFGPDIERKYWFKWLAKHKYEINEDGSVSIEGEADLQVRQIKKRLPFNFKNVSGDFICNHNNLTSLEGSPSFVGGYFACQSNKMLTTLEGAPLHVGDDFYCNDNAKLTSLKGLSNTTIGGNFYAERCGIESLEGAPKKVGGTFECTKAWLAGGKNFSDKDYRDFITQQHVDKNLSKDLDIDLGDFS